MTRGVFVTQMGTWLEEEPTSWGEGGPGLGRGERLPVSWAAWAILPSEPRWPRRRVPPLAAPLRLLRRRPLGMGLLPHQPTGPRVESCARRGPETGSADQNGSPVSVPLRSLPSFKHPF